MKILAQDNKYEVYAFQYWARSEGHKWISWNEQHTPAFDVFYKERPDIYIGPIANNSATEACIKQNQTKHIKVHDYFQFEINDMSINYDFLIDTHNWKRVSEDEYLTCEVGICNAQPPDPKIYELCKTHKVKILGRYQWPIPQYLGLSSVTDERSLYSSCQAAYVQNYVELAHALGCQSDDIIGNFDMGDLTGTSEYTYNKVAPFLFYELLQ